MFHYTDLQISYAVGFLFTKPTFLNQMLWEEIVFMLSQIFHVGFVLCEQSQTHATYDLEVSNEVNFHFVEHE
jgi:hypothetical protein